MCDSILSIFSDKLGSLFNTAWTRIKYYWNLLFNRMVPYSEEEALQYAYGILSGEISKICSFRNFSENRIYILVRIKEKKEDYFEKLILLKRVGNSFIQEWKQDLISSITDLEVRDLLKNGIHFILFVENSFGSGAGTKTLYATNSQTLINYQVVEHHDWSDLARANSPSVEFKPKDIEPSLFQQLEKYAESKDMLNSEKVDFSRPKYAVLNWHRMNGEISKGDVKLHLYPGSPVYGASIAETLIFDDFEWIAYFKGPLFGYIKSEDKHFIAYSPSWTYNWPSNLKGTKDKVEFQRHSETDLLTFEFYGEKGRLI